MRDERGYEGRERGSLNQRQRTIIKYLDYAVSPELSHPFEKERLASYNAPGSLAIPPKICQRRRSDLNITYYKNKNPSPPFPFFSSKSDQCYMNSYTSNPDQGQTRNTRINPETLMEWQSGWLRPDNLESESLTRRRVGRWWVEGS